MRKLWLYYTPLLFLPNLGFGGDTSVGAVELSDILIGPYLVLLVLAIKNRGRRNVAVVGLVMCGFALWTFLSTVLIRERYAYNTDIQVVAGLVKLGRIIVYGLAGVLAARAIGDDVSRDRFRWSLLASIVVTGAGLLAFRGITDELLPGEIMEGYKSKNAVSVQLAVLLTYSLGIRIASPCSQQWRSYTPYVLVFSSFGLMASQGRGGWISAGSGLAFLFYKLGMKGRTVVGLVLTVSLFTGAYLGLPDFRAEVDRTVWPDVEALAREKAGFAGFDDGGRIYNWAHEAESFFKSPLLGTGLFHRGSVPGLWLHGSHNFFLQMFLETGFPGGVLVLAVFATMWIQACSTEARRQGESIPLRTAIITAFVGGMTGEYYYGGTVLLTLLLVYAPVGAFGVRRRVSEVKPA